MKRRHGFAFEAFTRTESDNFDIRIVMDNKNFDCRLVMKIASKEHAEGANLIPDKSSTWARKDKLLLILFVLIEIGNGVEIYLPG